MTSEPSAGEDLSRWLTEARLRWPLIGLDAASFERHLARVGRTAPVFPTDAYLAAACAERDPHALRAFEDEIMARVPDMLRRVDGSAAFAADIGQQVRIRLLMADGDAPARIARYTGEVPLGAWVRVIALRLAFNAKRAAGGRTSESDEHIDEAAALDPEAEMLRQQYRDAFVRAFEGALTSLPKDDRTILRLHYKDGVNIDGIGRVYQVHRATVARWLVRIRADVLTKAKELLAEDLGAEIDEAASVMGILAGEVEVTLSRVLGKRTGEDALP
jgi:RNA polymerase sigma-70 factor (ECF subfamily)